MCGFDLRRVLIMAGAQMTRPRGQVMERSSRGVRVSKRWLRHVCWSAIVFRGFEEHGPFPAVSGASFSMRTICSRRGAFLGAVPVGPREDTRLLARQLPNGLA